MNKMKDKDKDKSGEGHRVKVKDEEGTPSPLVVVVGSVDDSGLAKTSEMRGGFGKWISRVLGGMGNVSAPLTPAEQGLSDKRQKFKIDADRTMGVLFRLRDKVAEKAVKEGGSFEENHLIDACFEPFQDIHSYALKTFDMNLPFWAAMNNYAHRLAEGAELGYRVFDDSVQIRKVIDYFKSEPVLVRGLMMDIFTNEGRLARLILKKDKFLWVDFLGRQRHVRTMLVNRMLQLEPAIVRSFVGYFVALPDQYINSEVRMEALVDFCREKDNDFVFGAGEEDRLLAARKFIASRDGGYNKHPYR